jgi:hypothetical protein
MAGRRYQFGLGRKILATIFSIICPDRLLCQAHQGVGTLSVVNFNWLVKLAQIHLFVYLLPAFLGDRTEVF